MENQENANQATQDQITNNERSKALLGPAVMLSVDMESNFKLYRYKCITEEMYIERCNMLIHQFKAAEAAFDQKHA